MMLAQIAFSVSAVVLVYRAVRDGVAFVNRAFRRAYERGYHHGYTEAAIADKLKFVPEDGPLKFRAATDSLAASAVIIEQGCRLPRDD